MISPAPAISLYLNSANHITTIIPTQTATPNEDNYNRYQYFISTRIDTYSNTAHRDSNSGQLRDLIQSFDNLQDNWDGYGADAIPTQVRSSTLHFMDILCKPQLQSLPLPEISPETNGAISMAWKTDKGDAYIEIGESYFLGYLQISNRMHSTFSGTVDSDDVQRTLESILRTLYTRVNPIEPLSLLSYRIAKRDQ